MGKDVLGSSFLIIGGVVFGGMSVVGISFLISDYAHSIPACGGASEISGFSSGPLPASAVSQRAQILKLNLSGSAQTPITGYQQESLLQSAAEVSKANVALHISNIGMSAKGLHGGKSAGGGSGTPGSAMGASGAGATTGFGGVGYGASVPSVPSAMTVVSPCAPSGGPPRAPSLSTAGGASSLSANVATYAAASPRTASISAGVGTNGGIIELAAGGSSGEASLGLYRRSALSSQALGGSFQELQILFSSGGSPVMGAIKIGEVSAPYGQQALAAWTIGGLDIPASTPSALDVATGPMGGTNPNSSTGVDYLAGYAAPDSGITYLSQFNVQSGTNTYLSQINTSLTPQSSGGSGRHQSSNTSGPADLSNTTPTDDSNPAPSSTSSSGASGASSTSSQASSPSTGSNQNSQGHSN